MTKNNTNVQELRAWTNRALLKIRRFTESFSEHLRQ